MRIIPNLLLSGLKFTKKISHIIKYLISGTIILTIFSCGFNSLLSEINKLPDTRVNVAKNEPIAFLIKEAIEDIINSDSNEYKQTLNLSYNFSESIISLNQGGSPNRISITLNIQYELIQDADNITITKGSLTNNDIIEIGENKFANYQSKEFSRRNLAHNSAKRIVNYIVKDIKTNNHD